MRATTEDQIRLEFLACLQGTLDRVRGQLGNQPFHAALLSPEAMFWSKFERSFSTSFGQRVVERISKLVVVDTDPDEAHSQRRTDVTLTSTQWEEIDKIINYARDASLGGARNVNWHSEVQRIRDAGHFGMGATSTRTIISDLAWRRDGQWSFVSIKTVKPNLDQTAQAKRDLLALATKDDTNEVFFGLPYNPYGEQLNDYAWTVPSRLFDMVGGPPVLIGKDYWDTLGGEGAFQTILHLAIEAGEMFRPTLNDFAHGEIVVKID